MKKMLLALFTLALVTSICFAGEASSTSAAASAKTVTFTGKLVFVSGGDGASGINQKITASDKKGMRTSFIVASDATIIGKDGNPAALNWISKDDKIAIEYTVAPDGTQTAKSIKVSEGW